MVFYRIIISRHSESIWNKRNIFAGWSDIKLTLKGIFNSIKLGNRLIKNDLIPTKIYSSELSRSYYTSYLIKKTLNNNIDIIKNWRLNERHYGSLEGLKRNYTKKKYGEIFIENLRPDYYIRPVLNNKNFINKNNKELEYLKKYNIDPNIGESIYDVKKRLLPFWENNIKIDLINNSPLLIISHKNTIKALMKIIEDLNEYDIKNLNINNNDIIIYDLDKNYNLLKKTILN